MLSVVLLLGLSLSLQGCSPTDGSCTKNEDCASQENAKVCDKNDGKCVGCLKTEDCADGNICDVANKVCKPGCKNDLDCQEKDEYKGRKKEQITCRAGACEIKCDSNDECNADEVCKDSKCVKGERPKDNRPGKYQECPDGECQGSLKCLQYKGGNASYCWKSCSSGCDKKTEVCVKEENFAEGYSVCMKKVTLESSEFNYDQGTACDEGLISLTAQGQPNYGTCWKSCETKCIKDEEGKDRSCLNHPNVDDDKVKFCFRKCSSDKDCPDGTKCREHTKANNEFYCY